MNDQLLTAKQVADLLAVPESWVREATREGRIPHVKLGRYRRYQPTAIEAWLAEQGGQTPRTARPDLRSRRG
jgi:excisionase family DNA binding protein